MGCWFTGLPSLLLSFPYQTRNLPGPSSFKCPLSWAWNTTVHNWKCQENFINTKLQRPRTLTAKYKPNTAKCWQQFPTARYDSWQSVHQLSGNMAIKDLKYKPVFKTKRDILIQSTGFISSNLNNNLIWTFPLLKLFRELYFWTSSICWITHPKYHTEWNYFLFNSDSWVILAISRLALASLAFLGSAESQELMDFLKICM